MNKDKNIFENIKKEELVDIREIKIDESLSLNDRKQEFLKQIKNPNLFKYGDICINVEYNEEGPTLEECINRYIDSL